MKSSRERQRVAAVSDIWKAWQATSSRLLPHGLDPKCFPALLRQLDQLNDLSDARPSWMAGEGADATLQEWMGHRDFRTTLIHADYAPGDDESGRSTRRSGRG